MATYSNGAYFEDLDYTSAPNAAQYLFEPGTIEVLTDLAPFFPDDPGNIGQDVDYGKGIGFYYPSFAGATDSVTFERQHFPLDHPDTLNQKIHKSGAGILSVYDSTHSNRIVKVNLDAVPLEKRQRLYMFFRYITKGALREFQYKDETGTLYTMRYIDKPINWTMKWWLTYVVKLNMWVVSVNNP